MKTNQNLTRYLDKYEIIQRTKDGYFNATYLLKQWNKENSDNKRIEPFFRNKQTKSFIKVLEIEEFGNNNNSCYFQKKGKLGGTWMHPLLFIKFAMWLNPEFEYYVIRFVYDQLIQYRNNAGDYYKELCSAIKDNFKITRYNEIGEMLNYVVFNEHKKMLRNEATPEQEEDLQQLERDMTKYINMGFVKNYEDFKSVMRKEWQKRHGNKFLI